MGEIITVVTRKLNAGASALGVGNMAQVQVRDSG